MSNPFDNLTPEQKKNFERRLEEIGFDPSHVVPEIRTGDTQGPTYLSSDPDFESAVPPRMITIPTLEAMKKIGGISDSDYENNKMEPHHDVPPEWPEEKSGHRVSQLTPEENKNIRKAFVAHVYGHSPGVKSYIKVIEKNYFPFKVAAFAAQNVVVDAAHPLVLKGPAHIYNFGVVTIKKGGQIQCEADADMVVQKMIKED